MIKWLKNFLEKISDLVIIMSDLILDNRILYLFGKAVFLIVVVILSTTFLYISYFYALPLGVRLAGMWRFLNCINPEVSEFNVFDVSNPLFFPFWGVRICPLMCFLICLVFGRHIGGWLLSLLTIFCAVLTVFFIIKLYGYCSLHDVSFEVHVTYSYGIPSVMSQFFYFLLKMLGSYMHIISTAARDSVEILYSYKLYGVNNLCSWLFYQAAWIKLYVELFPMSDIFKDFLLSLHNWLLWMPKTVRWYGGEWVQVCDVIMDSVILVRVMLVLPSEIMYYIILFLMDMLHYFFSYLNFNKFVGWGLLEVFGWYIHLIPTLASSFDVDSYGVYWGWLYLNSSLIMLLYIAFAIGCWYTFVRSYLDYLADPYVFFTFWLWFIFFMVVIL